MHRLGKRYPLLVALVAAAGLATAAQAQDSEASKASDAIVVTGQRLDGPPLFINLKRVAETCAECVRAMTGLKEIGVETRKELGKLEADKASLIQMLAGSGAPSSPGRMPLPGYLMPAGEGTASTEANSAMADQARWRVHEGTRPVRKEIHETTAGYRKLAETYFGQIEREVLNLANLYQKQYAAPKVLLANDDAKMPTLALDITAALIATMDQSDFRIDLTRPDPVP